MQSSPPSDLFAPSELARITRALAQLMPHVRSADVALTGGVAIQANRAARGLPASRGRVADLDFIARDPAAIDSGVSEHFLVSHYHLPQAGVPKFMLQLVDPRSRLRIDVFPDLAGSLRRARPLAIGGTSVNVLALEDILEHKLLTLSRASDTTPVDRKHALDAQQLGVVCGREVPPVPDRWLIDEVYCADVDLQCPRCEASRSPGFPLALKARIFELLGYV